MNNDEASSLPAKVRHPSQIPVAVGGGQHGGAAAGTQKSPRNLFFQPKILFLKPFCNQIEHKKQIKTSDSKNLDPVRNSRDMYTYERKRVN
jgi:hypothetical protein